LALSWEAILPSEVPRADGIGPAIAITHFVRPVMSIRKAALGNHFATTLRAKPVNVLSG
jgi:hypothetical protein